ncbi:uncharacterized protein LOC142230943 [Haematobia irritans]|uniref:uncharacterized protein LOC142230943 n=1 Tax=Haematobia irritans TaxID=7368 RepID=UPI003F4F7A84
MVDSVANSEQVQQISAVAVKLPPFWVKFPQGWFIRAESLFRRSNITTEDTKYDHVLSVLPEETIAEIFDIIEENNRFAATYVSLRAQDSTTPPPTPYTNLKTALISRNTLSEKQRLEQILSHEALGNRKPSEYYRHLRQIAGDSKLVTDELLKSLWLRGLPPRIHQSLISSGKQEMSDLCSLADMLYEVGQEETSSLFSASVTSSSDNRLSRIETQLATIASALEAHSLSYSPSRHRTGRSQSRKRRDSSPRSPEKICFYHRRYKNKARKCIRPCNYRAEN